MFVCTGGHRISTTQYPNENEFNLLSQAAAERAIAEVGQSLHAFCDALAEGLDSANAWIQSEWGENLVHSDRDTMIANVANELIMRHVIEDAPACVRCPECGRFYIQRQVYENSYDGFVPEAAAQS